MELLIVHYHLNPGGVTRIIEGQIAAIHAADPSATVKVLTGHSGKYSFGNTIETITNEQFNYNATSNRDIHKAVVDIKSQLLKILTPSSILHIHNLNLGKNPALTLAVHELILEGVHVVNHCHDFAEDRPKNSQDLLVAFQNYGSTTVNDILYVNAVNCHYAVLNSCDFKRVLAAGINPKQLHLLPNPVMVSSARFNKGEAKLKVFKKLGLDPLKKLVTYPVRAIQRKNIGEFILFAALYTHSASFVITQPPLNPVEIPAYRQWKSFCETLHIPVIFEAGEKVNYDELISSSDFCLTTSVREGFGMVYLEPWLWRVPVIGRRIACICKDLENAGMVFPKLYHELMVSLYGRRIDFAELHQDEQEMVIARLLESNEERNDFFNANKFLENFLENVTDSILFHNQHIIKNRFSINRYGTELLGIYRSVLA